MHQHLFPLFSHFDVPKSHFSPQSSTNNPHLWETEQGTKDFLHRSIPLNFCINSQHPTCARKCLDKSKSNLSQSAGGLYTPIIFHPYSAMLFTSFCRLPTKYVLSIIQASDFISSGCHTGSLQYIEVIKNWKRTFDSVWKTILKSQGLYQVHTNKRTPSILPTKEI